MQKYDLTLIGHITDDTLEYQDQVNRFTGGAAYFSSFAAKRCGAGILVITKMAKADFPLLAPMKQEGIEVLSLPSRHTTSIENIIRGEDVDNRKVRLITQAESFSVEDIPEIESKIYHLAGLFRGEIPGSMIEVLSKRGEVGLDLQTMLRCSEDGKFSFQDWPEKTRYLPMITYLKADSLESKAICGTDDREEAARMLSRWGAKEIMITHSTAVILYNGGKLFRAPFNPGNLSGRTGRGDTCFASYMTRRLTHGIEESLRFAAALTSIKMETPGPFSGTVAEVEERMKEF